jgi:hypothetical protein
MFIPLLVSWNNQIAYSNEITHIYICMKLHVYMCMKVERHKDSNFFFNDTKISKNIKKITKFCLFRYLEIHKDILKHYNL